MAHQNGQVAGKVSLARRGELADIGFVALADQSGDLFHGFPFRSVLRHDVGADEVGNACDDDLAAPGREGPGIGPGEDRDARAAEQAVDFEGVGAAFGIGDIVVADEHRDGDVAVGEPLESRRERPLMGLIRVAGLVGVAREDREIDVGVECAVHELVERRREIF